MKLVIADVKAGKSFQKDVAADKESFLAGKKIGEELDGGIVGLEGYKLKITGGSDTAGVPMRSDIMGQRRTRALLSRGPGVSKLPKGQHKKKLVVGGTISSSIQQVNATILEYGAKSLADLGIVYKEKSKETPASPA